MSNDLSREDTLAAAKAARSTKVEFDFEDVPTGMLRAPSASEVPAEVLGLKVYTRALGKRLGRIEKLLVALLVTVLGGMGVIIGLAFHFGERQAHIDTVARDVDRHNERITKLEQRQMNEHGGEL